MTQPAIALSVLFVVLTLVRLFLVQSYVRAARRLPPQDDTLTRQPHVSIFMPVRGLDPFIEQTISSVLKLDYPHFDLQIVVDNQKDPAWDYLQNLVRRLDAPNIRIVELTNRRTTCSLICSGLLQFLDDVENRSEVIALCASDMIVPKYWLRAMVKALEDPEVGTVLGNRWYAPEAGRLGSLVRYLWNTAAIVYMWKYHMPWGGTLGLRVADIRRTGLDRVWEHSMVEDLPTRDALASVGLKTQFVPELLIVNSEEVGIAGCYRFLTRQMLWTQLYNPMAPVIDTIICLAGILTITLPVTAALAFSFNDYRSAAYLAGAVVIHMILMMLNVRSIDRDVRRRLQDRNITIPVLPIVQRFQMPFVLLITQVVCCAAVIRARFTRQPAWRGVRYRINGPQSVQLLEYRPITDSPAIRVGGVSFDET